MEYADLGSLRGVLQQRQFFPPRNALEFCKQLLSGLNAIHKAGIVHGDIRPETLYVTDESTLKVGNFRLPSLLTTEGTAQREEWTGRMIDYLAPEILAYRSYTTRSDLYAAGILLYELLTGTLPFVGAFSAQLESKRLGLFSPPRNVSERIRPAFDAVLRRALAVEPQSRFESAAEFLCALRGISC
jgi:serine/threonine-protein kinase